MKYINDDVVKQVIVIRKDLNMRKGKYVAQGSHASMKVILDDIKRSPFCFLKLASYFIFRIVWNDPLILWLDTLFTKVVVSCNSEEELLGLYEDAKNLGIKCALITDAGLTEFKGVPTNTCIAIGPDYSSKIDKVTAHLKLL